MKSKKWGRIINVASAHALVASPFKSAYVASKHGIMGFTKTIALEVAEVGITVNAICPGYVLTPLVEAQIPDTAKARGITEEQVKRDVMLENSRPRSSLPSNRLLRPRCSCARCGGAANGTHISVDGAGPPRNAGDHH
jgi:3-hydroxybutyrate dehydrogenase